MPIMAIAASATTASPAASSSDVADDPEPDAGRADGAGATGVIAPLIGWPAAALTARTAPTPALVSVSGSVLPGGRSRAAARRSGARGRGVNVLPSALSVWPDAT